MAKNYTPEFNKQIRRIVYNYNRRVERLMDKYPYNSPYNTKIPPLIRTPDLKNTFETKGLLVRKLKQLESFNEDKMFKTVTLSPRVKIPKYEYESYLIDKDLANRKIAQMLAQSRKRDKMDKRLLPSQRTRRLVAEQKTLNKNRINNMINDFFSSKKVADRYGSKREKTNQQFFENFFDMLWSNVAYTNADEDLVQNIHDMIEWNLSPEQVLQMYNNEPLVNGIVEDYHKYTDMTGLVASDEEIERYNDRLQMLYDALPELIEKYKKY